MKWQSISSRTDGQNAFTLIEVISVLLILGILAAVAVPRMIDSGAEARVVMDKLKTHIRHVQLRSMNSDQPWGITCNGNIYFMFRNGDVNDKVRFMGEDQLSVEIPTQVSVSEFTISFNTWGVPYVGPDPESGIEVNDSGGYTISVGDKAVTILPETGFIQ